MLISTGGKRIPNQVRILLTFELMSAIGSGLVLPYFAIYLTDVRDVPASWVGAFFATLAVASIAGNLLFGPAAQRWGAPKVAVGGLLVQAAGLVGIGALGMPWTVGGLILAGLGGGVASPATSAMLAGLAPEESHPRVFAANHWVLNIGIGAGALLGGVVVRDLSALQFTWLYSLNAASYLLLAVGVVVVGRRTDITSPADEGSRRLPIMRMKLAPTVVVLVLAQFLVEALGFAQLDSTVVLILHGLTFSPQVIGMMIASNTVAVIVFQLPLAKAVEKSGPRRALQVQGILWAVAVVTGWVAALGKLDSGSVGLFMVFFVVFGLGECLYASALVPLARSSVADPSDPRLFALMAMVSNLSKIIGPSIGVGLVTHVGPSGVWAVMFGASLAAPMAFSAATSRIPGASADRALLAEEETAP